MPSPCDFRPVRHNSYMEDFDSKIGDAVRNTPIWVRHDLLSGDQATRVRAEETLAAMIANALRLKAA